jgi:hypothetical protein
MINHRVETRLTRAALGLGLLSAVACSDETDVGQRCPMEVPAATAPSDGASAIYPTVIEVNAQFPCDSLTCAATAGRSAYCTEACRSDRSCPAAFECRVVVEIDLALAEESAFARREYCVWRGCHVQLECGDVSRYDCVLGDYGPSAPPGLCGLRGEP